MRNQRDLWFRGAKEYLRPWYLRNVFFRTFPGRKPASIARAWEYPHYPLPEAPRLLDSAVAGGERRDFLFLPMSDMHFRMQRPHFLMQALADMGHRCFFLNPHLGREFRSRSDVSPRIARIAPNLFEIHVRLPREPVYHHRLLHPAESETIAGAFETLRMILGSAGFVQIVATPVWWQAARLIRQHSGLPAIYDCHDLIAGFSSTDRSIVNEEAPLIAGSDFIVCSSEALRDHCLKAGAQSERCTVIRNAVNAQVTAQPDASPHAGHNIGYVGALEEWLDVDSIRETAIRRPAWKFRLAGRVESERVNTLRQLPNVEFAGEIPADRVPAFLADLDVALIPFVVNGLTSAVDPIKLYEYLASGLPVVSSRLPETFRFADFVHYYQQPGGFVEAVESALEDRNPERRSMRRRAVAAETWEARARQLLRCLEPQPRP